MRAMIGDMGAAKKMTVEEWEQLDDDDSRELVDGVLVEAEMPSGLHDLVMFWLATVLYPYFRKRGGFAMGEGPKLAIAPDRGRIPDVVCFAGGRRFERDGAVRTPPDIVVEIISPRPRDVRRDRVDKLADYAAMGVKQYWLVDPKVRTFEIFQLGSRQRYTLVATASSGKMRRIPSLPGLVIDIDDLWSEVERYEPTTAK